MGGNRYVQPTAAALHLNFAELRKLHAEHMFSAIPPIADVSEPCRTSEVVPLRTLL